MPNTIAVLYLSKQIWVELPFTTTLLLVSNHQLNWWLLTSTNSEEVPVSEEQPEDTTKEPSASDGRTISIKCPAHAAKAIFSFAQALTPDTKLVDSVLILPEEYKQAVKTFIEVIL